MRTERKKSDLSTPRQETARPQSRKNFHIHVYVSDLYIPRSVYLFSCKGIGRSITGIYKSLTETCMQELELRLHSFISGKAFFKFPVYCLSSADSRCSWWVRSVNLPNGVLAVIMTIQNRFGVGIKHQNRPQLRLRHVPTYCTYPIIDRPHSLPLGQTSAAASGLDKTLSSARFFNVRWLKEGHSPPPPLHV